MKMSKCGRGVFPVEGQRMGREGGRGKRPEVIALPAEERNSLGKGPREVAVYSWSHQFFWKAAGEEGSQEK